MPDKQEQPLVSVCIPTYNGEKYLEEALKSLQSQTYGNIEVIISDDNSRDNTLKICERFRKEMCFPVHIYKHEPAGIGANWNHSIEKANGRYIKLLFQDDILESNCIEVMMKYLLENRLDIVVSKRTIIDEHSQPLTTGDWYRQYHDLQELAGIRMHSFFILSRKNLRDLDFAVYSRENIIGEPCVSLFTKEFFSKTGPFDQKLKQALDYEYWLRGLAKFDIGIIGEKLVCFRFHKDQTTNTNAKNNISEGSAITKVLFEKLLFHIDRKQAKYYVKNKYPILLKLASLKYRLFP